MIRILLLLIFSSAAWGSHHSPPAEDKSGFKGWYAYRHFHLFGRSQLIAEYQRRHEHASRLWQSYGLGYRYKLNRNFKAGLFLNRQQGNRHDEDWRWSGASTDRWFWRNTNDRNEDIVIAELLSKMVLNWPGSLWIGELRTRYQVNTYNGNNNLRIRPGLHHMWLRKGRPFISAFLRFEGYIPLNYSDTLLYSSWVYLGLLYHINKHVDLGINVAYFEERWFPTDFNRSLEGDWENKYTGKTFGITLTTRSF